MGFSFSNSPATEQVDRRWTSNMKSAFSPMNSEFYSFAAEHGIKQCPTLVPCFTYGANPEGVVIGIEAFLYTYWGFVDGIAERLPEGIETVFTKYMAEKGFGEDVFNIDTPEKATRFIENDKRLNWTEY